MSESAIPWKWIVLGAAIIVVALIVRCRTTPASEPEFEMSVVCADCGHTGEAPVGDMPTAEPWPRACPSCGKNALYLAGQPCWSCRKLVPMKDPETGQYGIPERCPWCNKEYVNY